MSFLNGYEYQHLYYESKRLCEAQSDIIEQLKGEKENLSNQVQQLIQKVSKLESEIKSLKQEGLFQNQRHKLLKEEVTSVKALVDKWEPAVHALEQATAKMDVERIKLQKTCENTEEMQKDGR